MKFALFYRPPCGMWYIHSHKLYETPEKAHEAAKKFLHPDTLIFVLPVDVPFGAGAVPVSAV